MSQQELALAMRPSVTAQAVGLWERGESAPTWHHQVAVARALRLPHSVLFAITEDVA
jgi:DNA-binding XRE family transcriptional regulator